MHNAFLSVEPAKIEWRPAKVQEGSTEQAPLIPYSKVFDDIYFDTRDGIAETDYVFLQGNHLHERFETLTTHKFVIVETGFGTGLNFLRTCKLWQELQNQRANPYAQLEFISIEQYPITPDDLRKMYQALNIESEFTEQLLAQYPPALPGVYIIELACNIKLTLIFSPVDKALKEFSAGQDFKIDAWYLDGFAPSKNPEMWAKGLLHFMALHGINTAERQTTFATFTAASVVRKQLHHYGFTVIKQKGFGSKRHMLVGAFDEKKISSPHPTLVDDYFLPERNDQETKKSKVAIIGGGLAGCATAYALHKRGIEAHLFEQGNSIASGASKMPALLATPNISLDHNAFSQLSFIGLAHLQTYAHKRPQVSFSKTCLQLGSEKYSEWQLEQYIDVYQGRDWNPELFKWQNTQIKTSQIESSQHRGLLLPGILVNGLAFCESLIEAIPQQQIHLNHTVASLDELRDFDHIILATGHYNALKKLAKNEPTLSPLRGQLTAIVQKLDQRLGLGSNLGLEYPINYDGHLFEIEKKLIVGATFDMSLDETANPQDREKNLQQANQRFGLNLKNNKQCTDYVGIRATTYDRFPYCGPLTEHTTQSPMIWTNYGFGTRGLCLSLLCAEVVASSISRELVPLPRSILQRISPRRIQKA